jgi:hypothetical protein
MLFLWGLIAGRLAGISRRFREAYCFSVQGSNHDFGPEDGDSMFIQNVVCQSTRRRNPEARHYHALYKIQVPCP